jgi:hypothetical protein
MKLTKAAIKNRQVLVAHMTMTPEYHIKESQKSAEQARIYSTERYGGKPINNGIPIPQILRDQIEATMKQPEPEPEPERPTFVGGWGFF